MKTIRRARHGSNREQAGFVVLALASIFKNIVELLTLGYYTSDLPTALLLDEKFDDFIEGKV